MIYLAVAGVLQLCVLVLEARMRLRQHGEA